MNRQKLQERLTEIEQEKKEIEKKLSYSDLIVKITKALTRHKLLQKEPTHVFINDTTLIREALVEGVRYTQGVSWLAYGSSLISIFGLRVVMIKNLDTDFLLGYTPE